MIQHYYLCTFSIYKNGDKKKRPHIRRRYVKAGNAQDAYRKAQEICSSRYFSTTTPGALATCKHKDIEPVLSTKARSNIESHLVLLAEKYEIRVRYPDGKDETISTFFGETHTALVELRSHAYDHAASGKCGDYPESMSELYDSVEEGFSERGFRWESKNGTVLNVNLL